MAKIPFISAMMCLLVLMACSGAKDEVLMSSGDNNCDPTTSTFSGDVAPVIRTSCATSFTCHGEGSVNGPAALTSYAAIKSASANIRRAVSTGTMPKSGSITAAQKKAIICWVDLGAPNN